MRSMRIELVAVVVAAALFGHWAAGGRFSTPAADASRPAEIQAVNLAAPTCRGPAMSRANRGPQIRFVSDEEAAEYVAQANEPRRSGESTDKPNILVIFGDDIGTANVSAYSDGVMGYETPHIDRIANEGLRFAEQRMPGIMAVWGEPFTVLRMTKLYNLMQDPYERADITSNTYWDWIMNHVPQVYQGMGEVQKFVATFAEFPPRSTPQSFNPANMLEDALREIKAKKKIEAAFPMLQQQEEINSRAD